MEDRYLALTPGTTELVVVTKKRINTIFPMQVGGVTEETKQFTKYFGLPVDSKMSFGEQIARTAEEAANSVTALSRLMKNDKEPKTSKCRVLMSTVQSLLLYGADIWAVGLPRSAPESSSYYISIREVLPWTLDEMRMWGPRPPPLVNPFSFWSWRLPLLHAQDGESREQ